MATTGRKRVSSVVRLVTGTRGRNPINPAEPKPSGRPEPPRKLTGRAAVYWKRYVVPAFWLTSADSQKAFMWVHMSAEYEASTQPGPAGAPPVPMLAARIAQLRALGSELGLDPASRARLGGDRAPEPDPAESYFA